MRVSRMSKTSSSTRVPTPKMNIPTMTGIQPPCRYRSPTGDIAVEAITVIDEARKKQMTAQACKSRQRKRSPPWTANGTAWPPTATIR